MLVAVTLWYCFVLVGNEDINVTQSWEYPKYLTNIRK